MAAILSRPQCVLMNRGPEVEYVTTLASAVLCMNSIWGHSSGTRIGIQLAVHKCSLESILMGMPT